MSEDDKVSDEEIYWLQQPLYYVCLEICPKIVSWNACAAQKNIWSTG